MTENPIATTRAQGYRRLGLRGEPLIAAHAQLVQILRSRLGREHAELFARPNLDPTSSSIEWFTSRSGSAVNLAEIDPEQRAGFESLTGQLMREIAQLAEKLKREGDSAVLAAQMLSGALQRPPGDWTFIVEGKPVLVMWGHVEEKGNALGAAMAAGVAATIAPDVDQASALQLRPAAVAPTAEVSAVTTLMRDDRPLYRRLWWLWLLLFLLLLLLAMRSCTRVDWWFGATSTTEFPAPSKAVEDALAKQRALLDELAKLRQAKSGELALGQCVRVDPGAPITLVPRINERSGPILEGGVTAPPLEMRPPLAKRGDLDIDARQIPETPRATDPLSPGKEPPVDSAKLLPADLTKPSEPDLAKPPASDRTKPPQSDAIKSPSDSSANSGIDKPLTIPPNVGKDGRPDFLRGDWVAGAGMMSTKGKPIDLSLRFDDNGKGKVTIRRKEDGSTCVGPVDAQMRAGQLSVSGSGAVTCDRGEPFEMPKFECGRNARGKTLCNGLNKDGSTYEMEIFKGRQ